MEKIITGKSVEEALDAAALELNVSKETFSSYEVLEQPSKGFLGFGAKEAKVKIFYEVTPEQHIRQYLTGLFAAMHCTEYEMQIHCEDMKIDIQVTGPDVAFLTSRRGEAVEAIQLMLALTAGRSSEGHYNISFNLNDYKEKCAERLEALAMKVAGQVSKTRKKVILNAMSAYQRRIIHAKLQDYKNIYTYSIGEDPNRRVVIAYQYPQGEAPKRRPPQANGQNNNGARPALRPNQNRNDRPKTDPNLSRSQSKINVEARTIGGRPFSPDILSPNYVPKVRVAPAKPYRKNTNTNTNGNIKKNADTNANTDSDNVKKEIKPVAEAAKTEE